MNRRGFLISTGAVMSGAAAAVGTGAFSNATVERNVTVSLAPDSEAVLRMDPDSGLSNSDYATEDGSGVLSIDISKDGDNVSGEGISPNAETKIEEIFPIDNQGTETVQVSVVSEQLSDQPEELFRVIATNVPGEDDDFRTNLLEDSGDPDDLPVIDPGQSFDVGVEIEVPDDESDLEDLLGGLDIVVSADASEVNEA